MSKKYVKTTFTPNMSERTMTVKSEIIKCDDIEDETNIKTPLCCMDDIVTESNNVECSGGYGSNSFCSNPRRGNGKSVEDLLCTMSKLLNIEDIKNINDLSTEEQEKLIYMKECYKFLKGDEYEK